MHFVFLVFTIFFAEICWRCTPFYFSFISTLISLNVYFCFRQFCPFELHFIRIFDILSQSTSHRCSHSFVRCFVFCVLITVALLGIKYLAIQTHLGPCAKYYSILFHFIWGILPFGWWQIEVNLFMHTLFIQWIDHQPID